VYKRLKGGCKENRTELFSVLSIDKMRPRARTGTQEAPCRHQLTAWVTEHWHRLPRGCGVSSLEISKSHLDMGLGALLWVSLLEWWLDRWTQRWFPSSVIL